MRTTKITKTGRFILRENTIFDQVMELAVSSYELDKKGRAQIKIDKKHFLVIWWKKNQNQFKKYKTMTNFSKLMRVHHSTINHLNKHRTPSLNYKENVECIKDFLNS
tara:strand:+ start:2731 stop:3051 length:321 start_codon:yes stop_codon:yes gene_type:complete